jgi:hypothetical protein
MVAGQEGWKQEGGREVRSALERVIGEGMGCGDDGERGSRNRGTT